MNTHGLARLHVVAMLAAVLAGSACNAGAAQSPAWAPHKIVELISPGIPGDGTENTVRLMQKIWQDQRLVETPVSAVSKPGGGHAVSLAYLRQHAGDPHYLLAVGGVTLLASHIAGKSLTHYAEFTPLALLSSEYVAFVVKADSPLKALPDLTGRLRSDAASVSVSVGYSLGGPNHVAAALLTRVAGGEAKKLKAEIFKSPAEALKALLAGRVDVAASGPAGLLPHVNARAIRILAITAPRRMTGVLATVPTLKENGLDVVVDNFRLALGTAKLQPAQIAWWDNVLGQLAHSAEWRKDLDDNHWENTYLDSQNTRIFLDAQYAKWQEALRELGMAK